MNMLRLALVCMAMIVMILARAQSAEQWMAWGDAAMERGEYYGASRFYEGALSEEPGRMQLQWKHAEASRLSNQYDKAADHYARVYQKDQGRTYPEALRWLAEMQMSLGAYKDAESSWQKLLRRERKKDPYHALRAQMALQGCSLATDTSDTTTIVVEHLDPPVNSYDSEFAPRLAPDGKLYFSSLRGELNENGEVKDTVNYRTRIYTAPNQGDGWLDPEPMPEPVNAQGDNANISWGLDDRTIYFTRCSQGRPCTIHVLREGASGPIPLPGLGEHLSTQPQIVSWDGREMLLFVSDRPGGEGGTDIWQAEIVGDSATHIMPVHGGVNTIGNERTPWFDVATNTLYFSSDFLPGHGGYDLFTSTWSNDVFGTPVNAGHGFNSPSNDLYPYIDHDRQYFWFTSDRVGSLATKGETCCSDIYRIQLKEDSLTRIASVDPLDHAVDTTSAADPRSRYMAELRKIEDHFPLKLYFHNDDPDPRTRKQRTDQTYLEAYQRYRSLLPEYLEQQKDTAAVMTFFREHVDAGLVLLNDLVDVLTTALANGERIRLEVRGHASPLAQNDYNRDLSLRRISSLRNHLGTLGDGLLLPYLEDSAGNGARLEIEELPFGEDRVVTGVSDDLSDLKRSVYSVEAMQERRIEIEALVILPRTAHQHEVTLVERIGRTRQGEERVVVFTLENPGDSPLRLLESTADCGCTTASLPDHPIPSGGRLEVEVIFNGRAPLGGLSRTVTIMTDGEPGLFRLTMEGEVIE